MIYIKLKKKTYVIQKLPKTLIFLVPKLTADAKFPQNYIFWNQILIPWLRVPLGSKTWICSYLIQYLPNQPWKKILMSWQHILSLKKVLSMNSNYYPSYRKKTDFAFSLTGWQKKCVHIYSSSKQDPNNTFLAYCTYKEKILSIKQILNLH